MDEMDNTRVGTAQPYRPETETPAEYWARCIAPKLRLGGTTGLDVTWDRAKLRGRAPHHDIGHGAIPAMPWLWVGASQPSRSVKRPGLSLGYLRAPGPHLYPALRHAKVQVHRLIYHLVIGPIQPDSQLRYRGPIFDRPNVNPDFYDVVPNSRAYVYEPPSPEELGGRPPDEDLIILILGGGDPSFDYTPEEIARAKAAIESR